MIPLLEKVPLDPCSARALLAQTGGEGDTSGSAFRDWGPSRSSRSRRY
jgi:hypothetical protein